MTRENQLDTYKQFIIRCTGNAKSVRNYTDFKRINECLSTLLSKEDVSILDFDNAVEFKTIADSLTELKTFVDYNEKGNNQYSNTIIHYLRFLEAKDLFKKSDNSKALNKSSDLFSNNVSEKYRHIITAIKTKPFLLLAGISGTGKSRIVRELARACSGDFISQKPDNFEIIQVKPNWHDSSEIIGYVSRVSGKPEFVAGDFIKFIVKAWLNTTTPYFLCLDEMNLAPVEQYFAEFLSVLESRTLNNDIISTDPILKPCAEVWFKNLIENLTKNKELQQKFLNSGISIPKNLIVIGTVNMDETTFSFSRKVLDRAMTIEMNEVDLYGGLEDEHENIGKIEFNTVVGNYVEGVDVYKTNKAVCDIVIEYLQSINKKLDGTPFKIAYRTRNDFLLYVVNNLPYKKDENGGELNDNYVIARALDEITSMKILSRIEGDEDKTSTVIRELKNAVESGLKAVCDNFDITKSISLMKLDEMEKRLESGFTSFWS